MALLSAGAAWGCLSCGPQAPALHYMQEDDTEPVSYQVSLLLTKPLTQRTSKAGHRYSLASLN